MEESPWNTTKNLSDGDHCNISCKEDDEGKGGKEKHGTNQSISITKLVCKPTRHLQTNNLTTVNTHTQTNLPFGTNLPNLRTCVISSKPFAENWKGIHRVQQAGIVTLHDKSTRKDNRPNCTFGICFDGSLESHLFLLFFTFLHFIRSTKETSNDLVIDIIWCGIFDMFIICFGNIQLRSRTIVIFDFIHANNC
ncbi:hypothetical protein PCPN_1749 [Pediococcus pentosaceus IE-3]|nr:hypothetical protein PCPN_1749 [Pediococcus pentosaceus IE-3]